MLAQALSDKFTLQLAWKGKLKGTSRKTLASLPWAMAAHSDTGSIAPGVLLSSPVQGTPQAASITII